MNNIKLTKRERDDILESVMTASKQSAELLQYLEKVEIIEENTLISLKSKLSNDMSGDKYWECIDILNELYSTSQSITEKSEIMNLILASGDNYNQSLNEYVVVTTTYTSDYDVYFSVKYLQGLFSESDDDKMAIKKIIKGVKTIKKEFRKAIIAEYKSRKVKLNDGVSIFRKLPPIHITVWLNNDENTWTNTGALKKSILALRSSDPEKGFSSLYMNIEFSMENRTDEKYFSTCRDILGDITGEYVKKDILRFKSSGSVNSLDKASIMEMNKDKYDNHIAKKNQIDKNIETKGD